MFHQHSSQTPDKFDIDFFPLPCSGTSPQSPSGNREGQRRKTHTTTWMEKLPLVKTTTEQNCTEQNLHWTTSNNKTLQEYRLLNCLPILYIKLCKKNFYYLSNCILNICCWNVKDCFTTPLVPLHVSLPLQNPCSGTGVVNCHNVWSTMLW